MGRIERVLKEMENHGLSQLLVSDPLSIRYLTGIEIHPGERFYALLLKSDGNHVMFMNRLFYRDHNDLKEVWYSDTDDYISLLINEIDTEKVLGVDKDLYARFIIPVINKTGIRCEVGSVCIDNTRAIKDETEQKLMIESSLINDEVMKYARENIKEGITEKELAKKIEARYLELGCQGVSFGACVQFGSNGSDPHHMPDDTVLKTGDSIVIDIGGSKDNYCSDMTRTYFYKEASSEQKEVYEIVLKANLEAEKAIKPGIKLCELDAIARNIISEAGYGEYFTHRLGHFIGQAVHEAGDVSSTNENTVKAGMTFSIEPGIYLPGEFGVRIEDLVLVTEDGCKVLNHLTKDFDIVK